MGLIAERIVYSFNAILHAHLSGELYLHFLPFQIASDVIKVLCCGHTSDSQVGHCWTACIRYRLYMGKCAKVAEALLRD